MSDIQGQDFSMNSEGVDFVYYLKKQTKQAFFVVFPIMAVALSFAAYAMYQKSHRWVGIYVIYAIAFIFYVSITSIQQLRISAIIKKTIWDINLDGENFTLACFDETSVTVPKGASRKEDGFKPGSAMLKGKAIDRIIVTQSGQQSTYFILKEFWTDYPQLLRSIGSFQT